MGETCFRDLQPDDVSYVSDTWLKSYADNQRRARASFYSVHQPVVTHLLATAHTLVACDPSDPSVIQGWCCFDRRADGVPVLHYAYVKGLFRGLGLGKALVAEAIRRAVGASADGAAATVSLRVAATHGPIPATHALCLAGGQQGNAQGCTSVSVSYDPHSIVVR